MDYKDALTTIYSFTDYEKRGFAIYAPENYSLDRVQRLLALLGNPHHRFRMVHVAGTKGKGSTAAMIESVLRAAGHSTGLYTSPHLHTFRERIQVNGSLIPEAEVVRLMGRMGGLLDQIPDITTFEVMTALALAWFADQEIEWAVLEVGLGGRLDATNAVIPIVSVITPISLDHTAVLGNTVAQIAAEKAGIVKEAVPVVSAPQITEALDVIQATCDQFGAPLVLVGRDWTWQGSPADLEGQRLQIRDERGRAIELWLPLLGAHQAVNAATAVAALDLVSWAGANVDVAAIHSGLRDLYWPGRLEVLSRRPLLVVDCAHNGDSARKLMTALKECCQFRRLLMVMGASADHATPEVLQALLTGASLAIATKTRHPRAASPEWLQARAAELDLEMEVSESVAQAVDRALSLASPEDLICCAGSVFVAAEAREAWFLRQGIPLPPLDPV